MDKARYKQVVVKFTKKHVAVIGDIMLDSYLWGAAKRISSEAPVPIIAVDSSNTNPGGAGNVALNLVKLGAGSSIISVIGNDANGDQLALHLESEGVDTKGLIQDSDRNTSVKTRVIAQNQQVVRVDQETTDRLSKEKLDQIKSLLEGSIDQFDAIIVADYDKGLLSKELIDSIIQIGKKSSTPIYVDPKLDNFFAYNTTRLFKPNLAEFKQALGLIELSDEQFIDHGKKLQKKLGAEILMVTMGANGMALFNEDGYVSIPTRARKVHDVSGAGDTVISTFTLADICEANPFEAASLANFAAGRVCEEVGVVPITQEMLNDIIVPEED
jgi:rfaE bifunctional protein kinase chain/domain